MMRQENAAALSAFMIGVPPFDCNVIVEGGARLSTIGRSLASRIKRK
jgi:hypothetical protein